MLDDESSRLAASLETITARIARIAIGLGVDMDNEQTLKDILSLPAAVPVAIDRRVAAPDAQRTLPHTAERRVAHLKEELRALVVLRYRLESTSIEQHGLNATRELLDQAHQHLMHQGFKPGADNWDAPDWQRRNSK